MLTCSALSDQAKSFVLEEGTDIRYGARHLKRTIARLLVRPISNLVSSQQVHAGDWILVEFDENVHRLRFTKRGEGLSIQEVGASNNPPAVEVKRLKAAS